MKLTDGSTDISPHDFESHVRSHFAALGSHLTEFTAMHKEVLSGDSGDFEIDVTIRFRELEVEFLVLVECKRHRNPIKREVVQILLDRVRAVGAHKGILVATVGFQKGAIAYAQRHGIALITMQEDTSLFCTRGGGRDKHYDQGCRDGYRNSDGSKNGEQSTGWFGTDRDKEYDSHDKGYRDGYRNSDSSKDGEQSTGWFDKDHHNESPRGDDDSIGFAPSYVFWLLSLNEQRQLEHTALKAKIDVLLRLLKPIA